MVTHILTSLNSYKILIRHGVERGRDSITPQDTEWASHLKWIPWVPYNSWLVNRQQCNTARQSDYKAMGALTWVSLRDDKLLMGSARGNT